MGLILSGSPRRLNYSRNSNRKRSPHASPVEHRCARSDTKVDFVKPIRNKPCGGPGGSSLLVGRARADRPAGLHLGLQAGDLQQIGKLFKSAFARQTCQIGRQFRNIAGGVARAVEGASRRSCPRCKDHALRLNN
jgi:hypothetical protein